jgi:hypothetical protein
VFAMPHISTPEKKEWQKLAEILKQTSIMPSKSLIGTNAFDCKMLSPIHIQLSRLIERP